MKKGKLIISVVAVLVVIVAILVMNKKKMASYTAGGIKDVYYVTVQKALNKNLSESLTMVGTIYANNDVNIVSETAGKVTAVYAKVGDYKQAGSVLFQVDDELKKAALMSAEANYEKAKKDYERTQALFQQKSATDAQLDMAKLGSAMAEAQYIVAKRQMADTKIKTPISGFITSRTIDLGSMVQGAPQATLVANVVDISRVKVKLNVAETDAFILKAGDQVSVATDVYPQAIFTGRIESVGSKGDDAHTFPVEISIANEAKHQLKAGKFARISFTSKKSGESIVIPRAALVGSVKAPQVFVVENGIAKLRSITVGSESGLDIQVLNGLSLGEEVVVSGQNNIVDNIKVEILK
ncbi:MAG: efflux RND transporter periplasmic adaptor subunit [Ignavibacteria bacterium]|nr:efflux RND transporter periplasmic adaptor subunit [Ignavibacteria bacterium]